MFPRYSAFWFLFCYLWLKFFKAVDQLIAKDKELKAAINLVQEQQARQQEIQTVKEEISKKDQEILNLESQLKEAEKILVSSNFNGSIVDCWLIKYQRLSVPTQAMVILL